MSMEIEPGHQFQRDGTGLLIDPHELRCVAHALAVLVLEMSFPLGPLEYQMIQTAAYEIHQQVCEDVRAVVEHEGDGDDDVIYLPGPTDEDHHPTQPEESNPWQLFTEN